MWPKKKTLWPYEPRYANPGSMLHGAPMALVYASAFLYRLYLLKLVHNDTFHEADILIFKKHYK